MDPRITAPASPADDVAVEASKPGTHTSAPCKRLRRLAWGFLSLVALGGAAAGGYGMGQANWPLRTWMLPPEPGAQGGNPAPAPTGAVIYYRHPGGEPLYSAHPTNAEDGGPYLPVLASEDVSFDDKPAQPPEAAGAAPEAKRVLYYRNPMGLPDTSPVPKKDSMGMDYLAVYEGEISDPSTVTVPLGRLQRTGVRSEAAERRVVTRTVRAPGVVALDERNVSVVSLRSESFIDTVADVTTGGRVTKGQQLLRLYSPEISAAAAQYVSDLNQGNERGVIRNLGLAGARRRLENLDVPPEVIARIERDREVPAWIAWAAPRDGIILERNVSDGMRAMPGDVLFRLADVSTIWVLADVPENEIALVKPGQQVTVRTRSMAVRGKVGLIYPQLNAQTRTARVRVELPNADAELLPAMYADIEFATGEASPVVTVPDSAVIDSGTRQVVLLDKGEGRFEPREVGVGVRGDGFVEIRTGISEGDKVVVSANFLIDAESNLKTALQALTVPEAAR